MNYVCISKYHGTHIIVDLPDAEKVGEFYLDPLKLDSIAKRLCTDPICLHCARGKYNKLYFTPRSGGRERYFVSESPVSYIDIRPLSEVVLVEKAKLDWVKLVSDRCVVEDIGADTDLPNLRSTTLILVNGILELAAGASSEREGKGKIKRSRK